MIEARQIRPRFHRVARLASHRRTVGANLGHLLAEFTMVRIGVASRAAAIFESVGYEFSGVARRIRFVAFRASDREMRTCQWEAALLVQRYRIGRRLKAANRVTGFALTVVRRGGELTLMNIAVAIEAFGEGDFVARVRARRNMAFRAGDR